MRADLLSSVCGAKDPNDRDSRAFTRLRPVVAMVKERIEFRRNRLIMIDAIQSDTKVLHCAERYLARWRSKVPKS